MDDVDGVVAAELDETLFEKNILSGGCGKVDGIGNSLPEIGALPGNKILQPGYSEFLQGFSQTDGRVYADMAEVIHGERNFIPDDISNHADVVHDPGDANLGQLDTSECVGNIIGVKG